MRNFLTGVAALIGLLAASVLGLVLSTGSAFGEPGVVFVTQDDPWDWTQTRATGHYEFEVDGLHVWTEGTTSTDKVAGYGAVAATSLGVVAAAPEPKLGYVAETGITPGYQLVVTGKDTDGVDRQWILVGEPVYGGKWWAASCADFCAKLGPSATGGGGSAYQGTLAEWAAWQPTGKVIKIGFSLGSGVHGEGVLKYLTFKYTKFVFKLKVKPTSATPTTTTTPPTTTSSPPPSTTIDEPPITTTTTVTTTAPTSSMTVTPRFANCADVRAAGRAPILVGTPGFHPDLDSDGDGIGCEREEAISSASYDDGDLASTGATGIGPLVAVGTLLLIGGASVAVAVRRRRSDGTA